MNALAKIQAAGFEIWLKDNGNIGIKPFDALTAEQIAYIKEHKAEIVEALATDDDRRHCRECRHLSSSGHCIQQRFRPVDDMPRRCADFTGYPDRIDQSASGTPAPAPDPLLVEVWTPNAQGRFFKFLATWPDGRQCYLCQMPRMTLVEMSVQYPDATHIEPVMGEEYFDD